MKHLQLWIWLKQNGLKQHDLTIGLGKSDAFVSKRMSREGFTLEEQGQILAWALKVRPAVVPGHADLFQQVAA